MSDVKDILGLSRDPDGKAKAAPRAKKVQMKKPEGMSREVFALLQQEAEAGRATVPLAPTVRDDGLLKEKRSRMVGCLWACSAAPPLCPVCLPGRVGGE